MSGSVKNGFLVLGGLSLLTLMWTFSAKIKPETHIVHLRPRVNVKQNEKLSPPEFISEHKTLSDEIQFVGNVPPSKDSSYVGPTNADNFEWTKEFTQKNCGKRPSLLEIEISNGHWQIMRMQQGPNSTLTYAYGAYLDTRLEQPVIRILINSEVHWNVSDLPVQRPNFCQIWYTNSTNPVVMQVREVVYVWNEKWGISGIYHPYLLTCDLPRKDNVTSSVALDEIPESVSLVEEMCNKATNDLHINYKKPEMKQDIGVCVKGLDMPMEDMSIRMIQWIEMLRILGAGVIHFHKFDVHPNTAKVLKYYEDKGQITVKPFSLPGFQPDFPVMRDEYLYVKGNIGRKRRQEVIAYNDCFMTYMHAYKYIAIIDIDEIILPLDVPSWKELVEKLEEAEKYPTSFCFQMILFVDLITKGNDILAVAPDINKQVSGYPYMMNKLNYERKTVCNGGGQRGVKCFHNTDKVLLVHNHFPRACVTNESCYLRVKNTVGYVHHHKDYCAKDGHNETLLQYPFGYDPTILSYNSKLMSRSERVIGEIGL